MEKRAKKLLDYDAQRAKVRKLVEKPDSDASKLPRNEGKLHDYRQAYENLNKLLVTEIPMLIDARVPLIDPSVEALIKGNLIFWRRGLNRLEELEKERGLNENAEDFLGGPSGEGVVDQVRFSRNDERFANLNLLCSPVSSSRSLLRRWKTCAVLLSSAETSSNLHTANRNNSIPSNSDWTFLVFRTVIFTFFLLILFKLFSRIQGDRLNTRQRSNCLCTMSQPK